MSWLALGDFNAIFALAAGIAIYVFGVANIALVTRLGIPVAARTKAIRRLLDRPFLIAFMTIVLVGPVVEEATFRGVLYGFTIPLGVVASLVLTTLAFTVIHLDLRSAPYIALAGAALFELRASTGGIATPVVAHVVANALGFATLRHAGARRAFAGSAHDGEG
jgi:membrane protease YdiL (CAAX protease family)